MDDMRERNAPRSGGDDGEAASERKPYRPPVLLERGTLLDLTRGLSSAPGDDAFTGTAT